MKMRSGAHGGYTEFQTISADFETNCLVVKTGELMHIKYNLCSNITLLLLCQVS